MKFRFIAFACVLLLNAVVVACVQAADDLCSSAQPGCVQIGKWQVKLGVGLGLRDNPLIESNDIPLFLLPDVSYYGERFFFDTYVGGFTFIETESALVNGIGTIGFDQVYFETSDIGNFVIESGPLGYDSKSSDEVDWEADNVVSEEDVSDDGYAVDPNSERLIEAKDIIVTDRLHRRDTAFLMGLELAYFPGLWDVSLRLLQDVSSVHKGNEVQFALSRFLAIAQEHFEMAAGFSWQDQKTLDYYWGVRESEVDNPDLAYTPDAGTSPFVRLDWRRHLMGNWSLQATLHHRWLSDEVSHSPLVEKNTVLTVFLGGVYHF